MIHVDGAQRLEIFVALHRIFHTLVIGEVDVIAGAVAIADVVETNRRDACLRHGQRGIIIGIARFVAGRAIAMQHNNSRELFPFRANRHGQRCGNLVITRVDGDVFFGILHCFCRILRRCQRAAGDAHCKSQKQGQELPHNCYTSQLFCASARWSV